VGEFVPAVSKFLNKQKVKELKLQILQIIQDSPSLVGIFNGTSVKTGEGV
jgi:hypothetical protein